MKRDGNPFLSKGFDRVAYSGEAMTVGGTVAKTIFLLSLVSISFIYSWLTLTTNSSKFGATLIISLVVALISSLATAFIPRISPVTAPIYALSEGVLLGFISKIADMKFHGIVFPAILLNLSFNLCHNAYIPKNTINSWQDKKRGTYSYHCHILNLLSFIYLRLL